mmetsp:Transcript_30901/g.88596  ORF Transcript_30901/g.88596 Transcript_30901/m.88596 type:complete len:290 (+) Transcript_30901:1079-1948(+)
MLLLPLLHLTGRQGPFEEQAFRIVLGLLVSGFKVLGIDEYKSAVIDVPRPAGGPQLMARQLNPVKAMAVLYKHAEGLNNGALVQNSNCLGIDVGACLDKDDGIDHLVEVGVGVQLVERQRLLRHRCIQRGRVDACAAVVVARGQPHVRVPRERAREELAQAEVGAVDEREAAVIGIVGLAGAPELQVRELDPHFAVRPDHGLLLHVDDAALLQGAQARGVLVGGLVDEDDAPHHLEEVRVVGNVGEGREGCLELGRVHRRLLRAPRLRPSACTAPSRRAHTPRRSCSPP